ncbi:MAG: HAMP domain-containing histidine kinase [Gammaproteobacteria bacterium]|nr:HAMP domain-containing histidine kinase [Gammaproteobacteria bacterium]
MNGQSEKLLEVLVDLERAKEIERQSRFESEALLEGLHAITMASSTDEVFASLLEVLRGTIGFDDAFILSTEGGDVLEVVATTDPIFRWTTWIQGATFNRVLAGTPVALFDVARAPEWEVQSPTVKARVKSALHASFYAPKSAALFICTNRRPGFFNKQHIHLLQRFAPLASQAMISLNARELTVNAFQAGVAETATSILHNIGNAITGIRNRAWRLRADATGLLEAADVLDEIRNEMLRLNADNLPRWAGVLDEASRALRAAVIDDIQPSVDMISDGVKHIAEIVTIQQGAAGPEHMATRFCLRRLLEDAVTMHVDTLKKYGVRVDITLDLALTQVTLPRNQLLQAVVNLIKNSREALQASAERVAEKVITLAADSIADDRFVLRVVDNGCGIEQHQVANLFSFGYSTKQGGHGYGLHWVANFVQSLNGTIAAYSDGNGSGMEIRIELPVAINRWS